ncbi:MAG TPA: hypothetical protein VHA78_03570 [Candidatus Peribacteraceae bacterium]|nr:hypothetical protein [Candidatus Peribacteraceae bacterium]
MVSLRKHWHFAHEHNLFGENRLLARKLPDENKPQSQWTMEEMLAVAEEQMGIQKINAALNSHIQNFAKKAAETLNPEILEMTNEDIAREFIASQPKAMRETYEKRLFNRSTDPWTLYPEFQLDIEDLKQKLDEGIQASKEPKKPADPAEAGKGKDKKKEEDQEAMQTAVEEKIEIEQTGGHVETNEEKLISAAKDVRKKFRNLLKVLEDKDNVQRVGAYGSPDLQRIWKEDTEETHNQMDRVAADQSFAEAIEKLKGGGNPDLFIAELDHWAGGEGYGYADGFDNVTKIARAVRNDNKNKIDHWDTLNESDKLEINQKIFGDSAVVNFVPNITKMHKNFDKAMDKAIEEYDRTAYKLKQAGVVAEHEGGGIAKMLTGVRFYSLNDIYHGAVEYWEALKHTWEHTRHTKSAAVANAIGNAMQWLPFYGRETSLQLNQNIRSKNRENTSKEKERLKESNVSWPELFGEDMHGGLLHEYLHGSNYDYARAVLEYAASRGWLYDLDDCLSSDVKTVFGYTLNEICADWTDMEVKNYYISLRAQNSGGRDDEMGKAEKEIFDNRDVPLFISEIESELSVYNIWAAAGICKRAIDRGLWGEISPWVTTTLMGKLRDDPMLRKLCNDSFFDRIGKISMYTTAPTLGWLKADGRPLDKWCRRNDEDYLKDSHIGNIILQLEHDVRALAKHPEDFDTDEGKEKMRLMTARILAGQTVEVANGKHISIFESKFDTYRASVRNTFASPAKPYEEDSDYYVGQSEQWLNPENVWKKILAHKSTGEFEREDLAKPFITKVVDKAKELCELSHSEPAMKDAYDNYIKETRTKLDLWLIGAKAHATGERIASTVLTDQETPAITALYYNGLISENVIQSFSKLWDAVNKQMKETKLPDGTLVFNKTSPDCHISP